MYDEQVFFQQFSLTSFNCSCVTAEQVLLDLKSRWHDELLNKADLVKENLSYTARANKTCQGKIGRLCGDLYLAAVYMESTPTESNVSSVGPKRKHVFVICTAADLVNPEKTRFTVP